ncbi:MAG: CZB domain-containing protein [Candidatus Omnitrophica bacterium]|nr:CZB domain-containing protein [Candidatus Omnitrophota bacterium]
MNFDDAIKAHVEWKSKLRAYLAKRDGSLKPEQIAQDKICPLGQWIHSEGKKYSAIPEYTSLKEAHLQFHQHTAQIVAMVNSGDIQQAETMLSAGSEFMRLSGTCVNMIMQLKQKVNK